jgi:hypothetical protein
MIGRMCASASCGFLPKIDAIIAPATDDLLNIQGEIRACQIEKSAAATH